MSKLKEMNLLAANKTNKKISSVSNLEEISKTNQYQKDLEAIKKDGFALKYVENQTPDICLAAVQQIGNALRYVKNQTPDICLGATCL